MKVEKYKFSKLKHNPSITLCFAQNHISFHFLPSWDENSYRYYHLEAKKIMSFFLNTQV